MVTPVMTPVVTAWVAMYGHRHGVDAWVVWQHQRPTEQQVIDSLGEMWEPEHDEWVEVRGPYVVPSVTDVVAATAPRLAERQPAEDSDAAAEVAEFREQVKDAAEFYALRILDRPQNDDNTIERLAKLPHPVPVVLAVVVQMLCSGRSTARVVERLQQLAELALEIDANALQARKEVLR